MKDLKSLKINFNISQTQEIPINTSGIQTYTLEQMVNCVMCEQEWEWSALRVVTDSPLMIMLGWPKSSFWLFCNILWKILEQTLPRPVYHFEPLLKDICYEIVEVVVIVPPCFSLSNMIE